MTMAIVFVLMDLFLVAITYGVYGGKTKYYEGMILGVHMEEQYAKGTTVTAFIQDRFNGMNYTTNLGRPVGRHTD